MSRRIVVIALFPLLLWATPVSAQLLAFPTAEGYGRFTVGGRGGTVLFITNTNDSGAGSYRACMEATGARYCIVKTSGRVILTDRVVANGQVTFAGQTSPGGFQVSGDHTIFEEPDDEILIRHLRYRTGQTTGGGGSPVNDTQGIVIYGPTSQIDQVIIDHSSFCWATDGAVNIAGWVTDITVQWTIICEGTSYPSNPTLGGELAVIGGTNITISLIKNVLWHGQRRGPWLDKCTLADVRNNLIGNWGSSGYPTYVGQQSVWFGDGNEEDAACLANYVKNHQVAGANSTSPGNLSIIYGTVPRKLFVSGNWGPGCTAGCSSVPNEWAELDVQLLTLGVGFADASEATYRQATEYATPAISEIAVSSLRSTLTSTTTGAGANKPTIDSQDSRLLGDALNTTGDMADWGDEAIRGDWPTLTGGAAPTDTDSDGMPDAWEDSHGLNKNSAADYDDTAVNGWPHLENYLNEMAGDTITGYDIVPVQTVPSVRFK